MDASSPKPKKAKLIVLVLAILTLISIMPACYRTVLWASSGPDLALLAYFEDEAKSYNPWDKDSVLISGDFAVWLIENFDWPYENRESLRKRAIPLPEEYGPRPYVYMAFAGRRHNPEFAKQDARALRILSAVLEHGEPVDAWYAGRTTLQSAVLWCDSEFAKILLDHGADPYEVVRTERFRFKGMNSFEIANAAFEENSEYCKPTYDLIMSHREQPSADSV